MDEDEFEGNCVGGGGKITECNTCRSVELQVIQREVKGPNEDRDHHLEERIVCRKCGRTFKQVWGAYFWEDLDEATEVHKKVIILENGAEVVIGKRQKELKEGLPNPEDLESGNGRLFFLLTKNIDDD